MKAVVCAQYGGPEVLQVARVTRPEPKPNEVLVKVKAASITTADAMMRSGTPKYARLFLGLFKPKNPIPGTGFSGIIEAIGDEVTQFKRGDAVFGETTIGFGANAEYVVVAEDGVMAQKPATLSHEEAATLCDGAVTSLNFLQELGKLQPGQHLLVNGAAGSLGSAAVQIGKYMGATVTGVCGPANVEFVKELGADHVIDYKQTDFTQNEATYDMIYDSVGKSSFSQSRKALTVNGQYLTPVLKLPILFQMLWTNAFGRKKVKFEATGLQAHDFLKGLLGNVVDIINAGGLRMVIDRSYPMEEASAAHQYIDSGHKRANIVLSIVS